MWIVTRKKNETIILTVPGLGEPIVIKQFESDSRRSKVGITAPSQVLITRGEQLDD